MSSKSFQRLVAAIASAVILLGGCGTDDVSGENTTSTTRAPAPEQRSDVRALPLMPMAKIDNARSRVGQQVYRLRGVPAAQTYLFYRDNFAKSSDEFSVCSQTQFGAQGKTSYEGVWRVASTGGYLVVRAAYSPQGSVLTLTEENGAAKRTCQDAADLPVG